MNGLVGWMYRDLFRWLQTAISACVWIGFPILLVMFFFKKLRDWIGFVLLYISYLTGFTCWVFSFIVTYYTLEALMDLSQLHIFLTVARDLQKNAAPTRSTSISLCGFSFGFAWAFYPCNT